MKNANLSSEFKLITDQLIKSHRSAFKKPDGESCSQKLLQLSQKFDKNFLSEYAGLCYLGISKCNEQEADVETFLKGARMFRKANDRKVKLGFIDNHVMSEASPLRAYSQALVAEKDSVMKTSVIRELNEVNSKINLTSDFNSPSHRVYELEKSSNEKIKAEKYVSATEEITEIIELFAEKKNEHLYKDMKMRIEQTKLLLLLIMKLSPNQSYNTNFIVQSPSHIKLIEKYSWSNWKPIESNSMFKIDISLLLEALVYACSNNFKMLLKDTCNDILKTFNLTLQQKKILVNLSIEQSCGDNTFSF